jgi:hypothetical protein
VLLAGLIVSAPLLPHNHQQNESNAPRPTKFAVLVGINRYQDKTIPPLTGSENDVTLLKETLIKDYAFDEKNIATLLSEQATRDAIITTFRTQLIDNAKKNKDAIVIFHFSGHGSRVPDQDNDENDPWDETLVPYDSRTAKGYDIRDDEIDDLFAELSQFTANATFIFDSCHSGTASRGDLEARESPSDTRTQPVYKRKFPPTGEDRAQKYVTISAALPNQRAYGRPKEISPTPNGALTFHLVAALKRASRLTTYRALMNEVATAVSNEIRIQDPQVEGDKNRIIFGGTAVRAQPYIEIAEVRDNQVVFKAGKAHGVQVGTHVAVYAPEATSYVGKEMWLTNASVTEVRDFVSIAQLPASSGDLKVTKAAKVVLAAPTYGGGPLAVLLALTPSTQAAQTLRTDVTRRLEEALLISNQLVQLVDSTSASALRLKQGKFKDVFRNTGDVLPPQACVDNSDEMLPGDTDGYYLDEGTGVPLFGLFVKTDDTEAATKITAAIANRAKQRNLMSLENAVSSLNKSVSIKLHRVPGTLSYVCDGGKRRAKFLASGSSTPVDKNELPLGSVYSFKLQNTSEVPLHVTAILLSNDGGIKVIFPKLNENDPLAGGGTVEPKETIRLVTTPPAGREVLKVIITRRHTDFSFLETVAVRRSGGSALERLLGQSGYKSRSEPLPRDAPDQWGVITFDLLVTN